MSAHASWVVSLLGVCLGWLIPFATHAATVEYIHTDAQGTPIAVTDASKALVESSEYEPYGQLVNGALRDGPGFTGHVQDAATGLTYMQQRYYDPQLGLFLSTDPVTARSNPVGMFNRYRYANNNPYRFTDPDGRSPEDKKEPPPPPPQPNIDTVVVTAPAAAAATAGSLATVTVTAPRMEPIATPIFQLLRTISTGLVEGAPGAGFALFLYAPHPCGSSPCGELPFKVSKKPDVPDRGPPGEWVDGRRRSRLYGPDGRPKVDIDKPHQGADYPHVHEWDEDGNREHPGREIPDLPSPESEGG